MMDLTLSFVEDEGLELSFDEPDDLELGFGEVIKAVVDVSSLNVVKNGVYEAGVGAAYNPVTVEVPDGTVALLEGTATTLPANITSLRAYGCAHMNQIVDIRLPELVNLGMYAFANCVNLRRLELPKLEDMESTGRQFGACTRLEYVDIGQIRTLRTALFLNDVALTTIVSRYEGVVYFVANAFNGTPWSTGGTIFYVPDDYLSAYQSAAGWRDYAAQIKGLSELPS